MRKCVNVIWDVGFSVKGNQCGVRSAEFEIMNYELKTYIKLLVIG